VDAKNFFASPTAAKPQYQRNQYGFDAGGPIVKNKTFIFGDWEGTNIRQAQSAVDTIPTAAERSGNFSQEAKTLKNPTTGLAFPGNIIPASLIDPIASKLINLYPLPQNGNLASNYLYAGPNDEDDIRWDVRGDYTIREKDSIYGRVSHYGVTIPGILNLPPPAFGANAFDEKISGWNDSIGWNHIFSGTLVAVSRIDWSYSQFSRHNPAAGGTQNFNQEYGIPGGDDSIPGGMSAFSISGYTQLGIGSNNPTVRNSQNRQIMSDLNWSRGAHDIKFGVNLLRLQNNILNDNATIGNWTFNAQYTGDGMADFLLGWSSQWGSSTIEQVNLRGWLPAAYVQDDWKISPRLTLNLGVRYEVGLPWYDTQGRMANLILENPTTATMALASNSGGYANKSLVNVNSNGWEPRLGLAYQLTPKTVIRTGYGIYRTYFEPMGDTQFLSDNPPFAYQVTVTGSQTAAAVDLQQGPASNAVSLAHATGLTFAQYPTTTPRAYAQQWNFNIQQQLAPIQARIIKGTYQSTKRSQVRADRARVGLHLSEDARQRGDQGVHASEESVVRPRLARVLPQPFGRIQLRRVGRQLMHLQPVPVRLEPTPHLGLLMVGGVVLNHDRSLAAISPRQLFEEAEVGAGIEGGVLSIIESCAPEFDGPEDLHAFALPGNRNLWRATHPAPGRMQGRVLPETGFVGEDQRPVPRLRFFLSCG
jgi:hypothetical protein